MIEFEQQVLGRDHTSVWAPIGPSLYRMYGIEGSRPYWHWSTNCSLILINEAHCYSVLGSSDQALK